MSVLDFVRSLSVVDAIRARKGYRHLQDHSGEWELTHLPSIVPKGRLALDVGASTGVYTFSLRQLTPRVVAFEPNPLQAARLRRLHLGARVEQVALSDENGVAELRIPLWDGREDFGQASLEPRSVPGSTLSRAIQVPTRRIDDYQFTDLGFIKIDVEGHEEHVLKGGAQTIGRDRPAMLIEIEERHNEGGVRRVAQTLADYEGYFFVAGRQVPIAEFDPGIHQQPEDLADAIRSRRQSAYVNNFIFVPRSTAGDR